MEQPVPSQQQMGQPQPQPRWPQNIRAILTVVIALSVLGIGYALFEIYLATNQKESPAPSAGGDTSAIVVVENTPTAGGVLPAPAGFPQDIPLEKDKITESATTRYPNQDARQLSVSYRSSRTTVQKYAEYKSYMQQAGYAVTEGPASAPVRAIFGVKAGANLSVAISSSAAGTLVQISYLLTGLAD